MVTRIVLAVGVLAVAFLGLLLALPLLMPSQIVREQVANQISELTGRAVTLRGDQALRVFPSLSVELTDVVIEGSVPGSDRPLMITETLRGAVRPLPLLFGRIEMASFEMTRPTIRFHRDAVGHANWALDGSELGDALGPSRLEGSGLQLGRFQISDGSVEIVDDLEGFDETITSADITLAWPSSSTRAQITGSAIWRGEPVELSLSLDQPAALAQPGSTSGVVVGIQSAPLRLQFDGTISPGRGPDMSLPWQAAGAVTVSTPSLRRTANWLGTETESGSTFGAFRLEADMNLVGLALDLTEMSLSLDGNDAEGVLTLDLDGYGTEGSADGRPSVQGTLDFNQLDLSPYLSAMRPTTTAETPADWRFVPLPDVFSLPLDMDVRFASRRVLASPLEFAETGGSVLLSTNQMVIGIGETIGYGGRLSGSLSVDRSAGALETSVDVSLNDVDINDILESVGATPTLSGSVTTQFLGSGRGETLANVQETLNGSGTVSLVDGTLSGIDLDDLGVRLAEGTLALDEIAFEGSTPIVSLSSNLLANNGFVELQDTLMQTEQISVTLTGQSHLLDRSLNLEGATAISLSNQTVVLPFELQGTWDAPRFLPDLSVLDR